jgi:phosphate acetyltransferase
MQLPKSCTYAEKNSRILVFADAAVAVDPDAQSLAEIGVLAGRNAGALLGIEPGIAFLCFSTKGSASHEKVDKVKQAVALAQHTAPELHIDGELQADAAIVTRVANKKAPQSPVAGNANVLIFPDLNAGNIAYKLVQYLAGATAIGPILQGFQKPVNDLSRGATVDDIVNVSAITSVQAGTHDSQDA